MSTNIFPQPIQCWLSRPVAKMILVVEMEAMHELNNREFPLPKLTWLKIWLRVYFVNMEANAENQCDVAQLRERQVSLVAAD